MRKIYIGILIFLLSITTGCTKKEYQLDTTSAFEITSDIDILFIDSTILPSNMAEFKDESSENTRPYFLKIGKVMEVVAKIIYTGTEDAILKNYFSFEIALEDSSYMGYYFDNRIGDMTASEVSNNEIKIKPGDEKMIYIYFHLPQSYVLDDFILRESNSDKSWEVKESFINLEQEYVEKGQVFGNEKLSYVINDISNGLTNINPFNDDQFEGMYPSVILDLTITNLKNVDMTYSHQCKIYGINKDFEAVKMVANKDILKANNANNMLVECWDKDIETVVINVDNHFYYLDVTKNVKDNEFLRTTHFDYSCLEELGTCTYTSIDGDERILYATLTTKVIYDNGKIIDVEVPAICTLESDYIPIINSLDYVIAEDGLEAEVTLKFSYPKISDELFEYCYRVK